MSKEKKLKKGFTLIELLIVIAVIAFVMTAVMFLVNSARMKARDTRRLSNMDQIKKALSMYYDKNGSYPAAVGWKSDCDGVTDFKTALQPLINDKIISTIPSDPLNPKNPFSQCYFYATTNITPACPTVNNNLGYVIAFQTETKIKTSYSVWGGAYPDFYCITP